MIGEIRNKKVYHGDCDNGDMVYVFEFTNDDEEERIVTKWWNPLISAWEKEFGNACDPLAESYAHELAQSICDDLYNPDKRLIIWTLDEQNLLTDYDRGMIRQAYARLSLENAKEYRKLTNWIRDGEYYESN